MKRTDGAELANEAERFELLSRVFRELPAEFGGRALHRLTAGRWELLLRRANAFLFSEDEVRTRPVRQVEEPQEEYEARCAEWEEGEARQERDGVRGVCEFLWVMTAPVGEVLAADASDEAWNRAVRVFAMDAPVEDLIAFMMEFQERLRGIGAAMVEPAESEGDADQDDGKGEEEPGKPSHTGWPAMSSRSEDMSARSGENGCCGGSGSGRGYSTCTAPNERPAESADGCGKLQPMPRPPEQHERISSK